MLHDYFVFTTFLTLGLILFSNASHLKVRTALINNAADAPSARKAKIWIRITSLLVPFLLVVRIITLMLAPGEVLRSGYVTNAYLIFLISSYIFLCLWLSMIYFYRLRQYLLPDKMDRFMRQMVMILLFLGLGDIIITTSYFVYGYINLMIPSPDIVAGYQFESPAKSLPFLIIIGILIILVLIFFILFIINRSLRFLKHYWIATLFLLVVLLYFVFTYTTSMLGWNEVISLRIKLLSWHYGYIGWVYALFISSAFFTNLIALGVLLLRNYFIESRRIRFVILPLIKTGLIALIGSAILTISPYLINILNF